MGGSCSGNWYRWDAKTTTENQYRIDIRWLKKQGYLRPGSIGSLSWSCDGGQTGSIRYRMEVDCMILNYQHRPTGGEWEPVEQTVTFDRTPCNYGEFRTWFFCPQCWKRVAVLYGNGSKVKGDRRIIVDKNPILYYYLSVSIRRSFNLPEHLNPTTRLGSNIKSSPV